MVGKAAASGAVFLCLLIVGCSSVGDRVDERLAKETERVCSMTESEREVLRDRLDKRTDPHKIRVECAE